MALFPNNPALRKLLTISTAIAGLSLPVAANASGLALLGPLLLQSAGITMSASGVCLTYTFDKNGNRLTQVTVASSSSGSWGTAKFGCFAWQ